MNARIASSVFTASLLVAGSLWAGTASAGTGDRPIVATAFVQPLPARFDAAGVDLKSQVDQGFALIRRGKQAQAVKLFDQVIAESNRRLTGDARPRLCAQGATPGHAVAIDPAVCDAHFGKGFALIDMGRGDLAEAELREAVRMAPTNAHFANEYAELFKSRREWQASYDQFAHAWAIVDKTKTGPDATVAARALRGMGFNKAALGQYDEAKALFEQSLQYEPGSEVAQAELGNIARRKAIGS